MTYHGPGQLVGYPIIDLRRIGRPALVSAPARGVAHRGARARWASRRNAIPALPACGQRAEDRQHRDSRETWVTLHGFALNVTTDLDCFDLIVPCGIDGVVMTSVARSSVGRMRGCGRVARREASRFTRVGSGVRIVTRDQPRFRRSAPKQEHTADDPTRDTADAAHPASRPARSSPANGRCCTTAPCRRSTCALAIRGERRGGTPLRAHLGRAAGAAPAETLCDIHCVTRWSRYDNALRGRTGPSAPRARRRPARRPRYVLVHAEQDYTTNLPLADLDRPANLLALATTASR